MWNCELRCPMPPRLYYPAVRIIAIGLVAGLSFDCFSLAAETSSEQSCGRDETKSDEGCIKNPKVIHKVEPSYPLPAWKARAGGGVTLSGRVNIKGRVEEIKVVRSHATDDMYLSGFERAAMDALAHWRYRPGSLEGKPVPVYFEITMDFSMEH